MPLTDKGTKVMNSMVSKYGPEKGKSVFYASKNAGTISGVDGTLTTQNPVGQTMVGTPPAVTRDQNPSPIARELQEMNEQMREARMNNLSRSFDQQPAMATVPSSAPTQMARIGILQNRIKRI